MFVCQTHDEEIVRGTRKSRIFDRGFLQAPIDLPHPGLRKHFRCEIHPIDLRHTFRSEPTSSSSGTAREIETLPRLWPPYRVDSLEDSYVQQTGHGRFIGVRPLGIANLWRNRWVLALIEVGEVHVRFSTGHLRHLSARMRTRSIRRHCQSASKSLRRRARDQWRIRRTNTL